MPWLMVKVWSPSVLVAWARKLRFPSALESASPKSSSGKSIFVDSLILKGYSCTCSDWLAKILYLSFELACNADCLCVRFCVVNELSVKNDVEPFGEVWVLYYLYHVTNL